jgi:chromate transporter
VRISAIALGLWFLPIMALAWLLGSNHVFVQEGVFFSKMAVVTFGGAYAVLAYVSQQAVEQYGWLAPGEMLDGLGLAETTPGPLILVVQFVGFLGAYRNPGLLDPMLAGTLGALLTTWVTFVPCFLWIFLGAPYIDRLRDKETLSAGLSAITAAVVGVVLNLAVWFGLHVLFAEVGEVRLSWLTLQVPAWATLDVAAAALAAGALVAMLRFRVPMVTTLASCAALGAAYQYLQ